MSNAQHVKEYKFFADRGNQLIFNLSYFEFFSCPSLNIDSSTDVRICLDQEKASDIYTCNSNEVNIAHLDE